MGIKFYRNFITVSDYSSQIIRSYNKEANINIISNGVDIPDHPVKVLKSSYILFLGRIDFIGKGLDTLLISLGEVIKRGYKPKLILAGAGENNEIQKVTELINDLGINKYVDLIGPVSGENKYRLLEEAKFLVYPSRNETFGITALEAFSFHKPVIGTSIGGLKSLLEDSHGALIFNPEDSKLLARHIITFLTNVKLVEKLGENGYKFSLSYSWDIISIKYRNLLNNL